MHCEARLAGGCPFSMNVCSWKSICNEITDDYILIYNLPDMQTSSDHDWLYKKTPACVYRRYFVFDGEVGRF